MLLECVSKIIKCKPVFCESVQGQIFVIEFEQVKLMCFKINLVGYVQNSSPISSRSTPSASDKSTSPLFGIDSAVG